MDSSFEAFEDWENSIGEDFVNTDFYVLYKLFKFYRI